MKAENRIRNRIRDLAREYRSKGYAVYVEPKGDTLPDFLSEYSPDLIAVKEDESVVIEVKTKETLATTPKLRALADTISHEEGWRLDLVITNPRQTNESHRPAGPSDLESVLTRLAEAEHLAHSGSSEAGMLLTWSAAEGLLRFGARRAGLVTENATAIHLAAQLYSHGLIGDSSYRAVKDNVATRNSLVHGQSVSGLTADEVKTFAKERSRRNP